MSRFKHITVEEIREIGRVATKSRRDFSSTLDTLVAKRPAAYAELIAVMHIGRGDDTVDRYDGLIRELGLSSAPTGYIYEKNRIFERYIKDGLRLLGE